MHDHTLLLQADNTLRMARIWKTIWAQMGVDPSRVVVVAWYGNPNMLPYFTSTFGSNASAVDAIAFSGAYGSTSSWNSHRPCYYEFNSKTWVQDPKNANLTLEKVLSLCRSSVIHADITYNKAVQLVKALGKRMLGSEGVIGVF
jgi:hypothetical protein